MLHAGFLTSPQRSGVPRAAHVVLRGGGGGCGFQVAATGRGGLRCSVAGCVLVDGRRVPAAGAVSAGCADGLLPCICEVAAVGAAATRRRRGAAAELFGRNSAAAAGGVVLPAGIDAGSADSACAASVGAVSGCGGLGWGRGRPLDVGGWKLLGPCPRAGDGLARRQRLGFLGAAPCVARAGCERGLIRLVAARRALAAIEGCA